MADPTRDRDPVAHDPRDPADPAARGHPANEPPRPDPVTGTPHPADTVVVDNARRSGSSNALVLGVIAAAIVVALLVFMNWTPATDTAAPDGAVTEEPAATDGAIPPPATTEPADEAPAATEPAPEDTAPAPADEAPATTEPAPAE